MESICYIRPIVVKRRGDCIQYLLIKKKRRITGFLKDLEVGINEEIIVKGIYKYN